jgi:long-chain acyl-CoA synthetase
MERVELLGALEERYQVELDESKFAAATTVRELEDMIQAPALLDEDVVYPAWAQNRLLDAIRFVFYYVIIWPLTHLLAHPAVVGRKTLRRSKGPLLLVSNHVTQVDVAFVLAALCFRYRHRLAVAMSGELLQAMRHPPAETGIGKRIADRLSYWLVTVLFNVFPLPQQTGFRRSFAFAGESVDRGYSILVFPEGGRTKDGRIAIFRNGVGLLAHNLGLPVVPLRIDGLYELRIQKRKLAGPGRVKVRIGDPVRFAPETPAEEIAAKLRSLVSSL